jgi:formylmethanofuran dehydrogenase subunit B
MTLEIRDGGLAAVQGGCPACREEIALFRDDAPAARVLGKEVSTDQAIEAAARLLREARSPFVYGLALSANATTRRAAAIAAALGGAVDVEGADAIGADLAALATYGLPSSTFGEIRDRADLVFLWRCDPRLTHPALFDRRRSAPRTGAPPASVALVPRPDLAANGADLVLPVGEGADLDAALSLRALVNGQDPSGESAGGARLDDWRKAAGLLRSARYSAILWDGAATASVHGFAIASALTLLARDLNRVTRSVARPLGAGGNVAGAVATLAAATGFPRAIGFGGGTRRFAPDEFGAGRMIGERGADVLLLVGARSAAVTPRGGTRDEANKDDADGRRRRSGEAARIVVGPRLPRSADDPEVFIPTATPGLSSAGLVARADGVTVVLKALVATRLPTEDDVLDRLAGRLAAAEPSKPTRRSGQSSSGRRRG